MLMQVITVVIATVVSCFLKYLLDVVFVDRLRYPPGPLKLPFIGNLLDIDQAYPHRSFVKLAKKYGPVYTVWLPRPVIVVADFKLLKEINTKLAHQVAGRPEGFLYGIFSGHKKDGDGIILCQKDRWAVQRKFALTTFHNFGVGTRVMETKIDFHKDLLLSRLNGLCDLESGVGVVDLSLHVSFCVGNIINDLVMGRYYHFGEPEFLRFKHLIDSTLEGFASISMQIVDMYPWIRHFVPYYHKYVRDGFEIQKFFLEEIVRHENAFDERASPTNFIDAYLVEMRLKRDHHLSKLTLALDAGDLWTGGMETTVTTLLWAVIHLMYNPEVQEALQMEVDQVLDRARPSSEAKRDMPLMQAVLDEVQRIINVLPWGIPHQVLEDVDVGGHAVRQGTTLMPQVGAVHFDEALFPRPEEFNPLRFIDEAGKYKKDKHLMPFGLGKRSCLGEGLAKMELFLIFTSLVQNFSFHPYQGEMPSLERTPGMTSVPKKYLCQIKQRRQPLIARKPKLQ